MSDRTDRDENNRQIERIQHRSDECIGNWRLVGSRMICDTCKAEYEAVLEDRLAAIDENYAGILMRRLAAEGAAQIRADQAE